MEGTDSAAPTGMELRLVGVPIDMSAHDLLVGLGTSCLKLHYAFSVVLDKSSEELFWERFNHTGNGKMTARVIIPNVSGVINPGTALVGRNISVPYGHGTVRLRVVEIPNSETTNRKYGELRATKLALEPVQGIQDGRIGYLRRVSYGNFDGHEQFETVHTWGYGHEREFGDLSYFGDARPPKFRVCLTESNSDEQLNWEWMDFHETNIRGVLFEQPQDQDHRVVYFVLDKPPQYYRRTEQARLSGSDASSHRSQQRSNLVHTRISYPGSLPRQEAGDLDVCGVPWPVQYCRVIKVEYQIYQDFNLQSYKPRINKERKEALFCLELPGIADSGRSVADMITATRSNLQKIATVTPNSQCTGCQLGLVKLLYNCNLIASSPRETYLLDKLIGHHSTISAQYCRLFTEGLNKMAQDMGTYHVRALNRLRQPASRELQPTDQVVLPSWPANLKAEPHAAFERYFNTGYFAKEQQQRGENYSPGVFEAQVYPSHVELQGPIDPTVNSVTDQYRDIIERFLRVKFVDNTSKPLKPEAGIDLDNIIQRRVVRVLTHRNQPLPPLPALQGFEFLGYSMSSLKKRKAVWFFQRQGGVGARTIRDGIGDWDVNKGNRKLANHPSKWGARISLAFTEAIPVVSLYQNEWQVRDDVYVRDPEFPNTDGCGLISFQLCKEINAALAPYGFTSAQAFQIRLGGVKGVVYAGAESLLRYEDRQWSMLLRKSQLKIHVPDSSQLELRIVSTAGDGRPSLFFASALKAFEDSGADTAVIEKIYDDAYAHLTTASSASLDMLQEILKVPSDDSPTGMEARYVFLKLAIRLRDDGIHPHDYDGSFLTLYLTNLAANARDKDLFNIPIPGSFSLLGVTDDYEVLRRKEVFIRARGQTISGPVLIYRDPIIHIGDIQEAKAVSEEKIRARMNRSGYPDPVGRMEALCNMDNVIFFSQADDPPFPNRLSGGDLDGDRFEVLTKDCRFWGDTYRTSDPDSYTDEGPPANKGGSSSKNAPASEPFDVGRLAGFIGQYIRNDCFAELQDRLLALADQKKDGMRDRDVKKLAKWLSQAVDYAKSGNRVSLMDDVLSNPNFKIRGKPDFLHGVRRKTALDTTGENYQSHKLPGKIYRKFESIRYYFPQPTDNSSLVSKVDAAWTPVVNELLGSAFRDNIIPLEEEVANGALGELGRYQNSMRNAAGTRLEADMFPRKQLDDFPFNFVQQLLALVSNALSRRNIVTSCDGQTEHPRVRPMGYYDRDTVENIFRVCLYWAWKNIIQYHQDVTGIDDSEGPFAFNNQVDRFGQSYAFLCLYALYCTKLPIEERDV